MLEGLDPQQAGNALLAIATAVAGLITWILQRRNKAKKDPDIHNPTAASNAYTQLLLKDRAMLMTEFDAARRLMRAEIDEARKAADEAWRARETATAELASVRSQNVSLSMEVSNLKNTVDKLVRALHRLDPNLMAAFGSDFIPLE